MPRVRLHTAEITDFASFHEVCRRTFGFPDFYGRNMDAWIDCMSDTHGGMMHFTLEPGERLHVEVSGFAELRARTPEVAAALVECTELVNRRHEEVGSDIRIILHFS